MISDSWRWVNQAYFLNIKLKLHSSSTGISSLLFYHNQIDKIKY